MLNKIVMESFFGDNKKSLITDRKLIASFIFISLLFLCRSSFPFFKYPFILIYPFYFTYVILLKKTFNLSSLKKFVLTNLLAISLILLIFFAYLTTYKAYLSVFKDLINILILLSLFFIGTLIIRSRIQLSYFVSNLGKQLIFFAVFISVTLLLNQLNIFSETSLYSRLTPSIYSTSSKVFIDTNFALVPIFLALILLVDLLFKNISKLIVIVSNLLLYFFLVPIILSGSKRGIILIFILFVVFIIIYIVTWNSKKESIKTFWKNSRIFRISLLISPLILFLFIKTSFNFKTEFLRFIGTEDISAVRYKITSNLFRYVSVFDDNADYSKIYNKIWNITNNPKDPDSGWGIRIHKSIFPLTGKNVEMLPPDVIGYMMDSTCDVVCVYKENILSRTLIYNINVNHNIVKASVYCFVSEDFNGDLASLEILGRKGTLEAAEYDLNMKNIWQKLEIKRECEMDTLQLALWFSKNSATDFSNLKGYVVFANPVLEILQDTLNSIESNIENLNPTIKINPYSSHSKHLTSASLININYNLISIFYSIIADKDPIRNFASRFFSEDTAYLGYKTVFNVQRKKDDFGEDRISRWRFASEIFIKEYNFPQKVFGGGFSFLSWYGYFFYGEKNKTDYPHNPFLSVLLYSGLLGLVIFLIFVLKAFYYYIKYLKEYKVLFFFFIVTFFFSFFSAGNPFDPPIMGYFVLLPFFINYIHLKDHSEIIEIN